MKTIVFKERKKGNICHRLYKDERLIATCFSLFAYKSKTSIFYYFYVHELFEKNQAINKQQDPQLNKSSSLKEIATARACCSILPTKFKYQACASTFSLEAAEKIKVIFQKRLSKPSDSFQYKPQKNPLKPTILQLQKDRLTKMNNESAQNISSKNNLDDMYLNRLVYPSFNAYFSPRFYMDRVDYRSIPMCAYTGKIEATNIAKIHDKPTPPSTYLRELQMSDGLIYQMKRMSLWDETRQRPPKIKVIICVCMYNESKNAINLTLNGIYNNLPKLQEQGIAAEQVGVVLMQDGILKLVEDRKKRTYAKGDKSMVEFYKKLDMLDGKHKCDLEERINIILDEIENYERRNGGNSVTQNRDFPPSIEKNISLVYQNLWCPSMTDDKAIYNSDNVTYLRLFSCFKHLNGTKLSSHLWFFQGFCRYLDPQYIVLLDVGTVPEEEGIVNLLRGFNNKNVGGVTGLMSVDSNFPSEEGGKEEEQEGWLSAAIRDTFYSVEKAQQYEYIISHFIDKNAESTLGFLHVLPGAWSAYRFKALVKSQKYEPNLLEHSYFKMLLNPNIEQKDYKQANMYLAEDRILSLGIYCQPGEQYYLRYIPDAIAKTDPMKSHEDLMKQRRRWINSSMFAFLYVWDNYHFNSQQSKHGAFDKYFKLNLAMLMSMLSLVTAYISPSLTFYVLLCTIEQIDLTVNYVLIIARVISIIYVLIYMLAIGGSLLGNVWTKYAHYISAVMGFYTYGLLGLVSYNIVVVYLDLNNNGVDWTNFSQMSIFVMILVNIGTFFLIIFFHLFTHPKLVWRLICDQISYISYQGAYTQTMLIHAFCNVDDVSWGTKGSNAHGGQKKYNQKKIAFVSSWLFYNALIAYILIYIDSVIPNSTVGVNNNRRIILIAIGYYSAAYMLLKATMAMYHHIKWIFTQTINCCKRPLYPERKERVKALWKNLNKEYVSSIAA